MLKFMGIGGAFCSKLGNCCAYYKNKKNLLLIDCGENIFEKIQNNKLLNDLESLDIVLTHFHSDHVGSLGSLLFYCDKIGLYNVNIIYPNLDNLKTLLKLYGVENCCYNLCKPKDYKRLHIKEYRQKHSNIEAYGYLIKIDNNCIYYSGDTKIIPENILKKFINNEINYFYQDVRIQRNNFHISLDELVSLIPFNYRKKVNCMHFDTLDEIAKVKSQGFSVVEIS